MFIRNKSIIKTFLRSNRWNLRWKNCLAWIRREICTDQAPYVSQNGSKQTCQGILMWEITGDFFAGVSVIMDSYFGQKWRFKVEKPWWIWIWFLQQCNNFSLHKMLIDGLGSCCGSLWCFYQPCELSFWRHPFTNNEMLNCGRNKLIYILD